MRRPSFPLDWARGRIEGELFFCANFKMTRVTALDAEFTYLHRFTWIERKAGPKASYFFTSTLKLEMFALTFCHMTSGARGSMRLRQWGKYDRWGRVVWSGVGGGETIRKRMQTGAEAEDIFWPACNSAMVWCFIVVVVFFVLCSICANGGFDQVFGRH